VHEIDSSFHDVFRLHQSRRIRNNLVTASVIRLVSGRDGTVSGSES
jgi:hypothetical protein